MANNERWLQDVVEAAEEVLRTLPSVDYKEGVYEEALSHEMRIRGIPYERQRNLEILYKGYSIGTGTVDFIINPLWATGKEENVLEIKSVTKINKSHIRQAQVYMSSLNIKRGAVLSMRHSTGVEVKPLELLPAKPPDRSVVMPKAKRFKEIKELLEYAQNEVYQYFGSEFIYREATNIEWYKKAMEVEIHLNGINFQSVAFPVVYKCQNVYEFKIDFVFEDNTAFALCVYEKKDDVSKEKEFYAQHIKFAGIKKIYLGMLPKKGTENAFIIEVGNKNKILSLSP